MTFRAVAMLLAGSAGCGQIAIAQGPPADYLASLPKPATVIAGIKADDALERYAQQAAALKIFSSLIYTVADTRHEPGGTTLTAAERTPYAAFNSAFNDVLDSAYKIVDATDSENRPGTRRDAWNQQRDKFARDPQFRLAVLDRHLPADLRDQLLEVLGASQREHAATMAGIQQDIDKAKADRAAREAASRRADSIAYAKANPPTPPIPLRAKIIGAVGGAMVLTILVLGFLIPFSTQKAEEVQFFSETGVVQGFEKRSETHVTSNGGGTTSDGTVTPVRVSSYTVVHTSFFLTGSGRESPVQFSGRDIPIRNGQKVSMLWATHPKRNGSPYMRLVNHDAEMRYRMTEANVVAKRFGLVAPVWLVIFIGIIAAFLTAIPGLPVLTLLSESNEPIIVAAIVSIGLTTNAVAIAYWIWARRRARKVYARVDARADEAANAVGRGESLSAPSLPSTVDSAHSPSRG